MAHFARLDDNNVVSMVIVVSNGDMTDENGNEIESLGVAICEKTVGDGPWIQTSYNGNFRRQFAGLGFVYLVDADIFIRPSPCRSWTLNDNYDWQAPVAMPDDGQQYAWNEEAQTWDLIPTEEPTP